MCYLFSHINPNAGKEVEDDLVVNDEDIDDEDEVEEAEEAPKAKSKK